MNGAPLVRRDAQFYKILLVTMGMWVSGLISRMQK